MADSTTVHDWTTTVLGTTKPPIVVDKANWKHFGDILGTAPYATGLDRPPQQVTGVTGRSTIDGKHSGQKTESMSGMLIDPVIACGLVIFMILIWMIKRLFFSS